MKDVMRNILQQAGMSNSSDKPEVIQCEYCGKDKEQIQIEHPFKKVMHWVHCACTCETDRIQDFRREQESKAKLVRINRSLKLSSAMDEIKHMTFENYKIRPGTESAQQEVNDAVANFEDRGRLGVFIFGETGNGKSHLTAAGGNALIAKGYAVIFIAEKDLLSRLLATKNFNNKESFHEIMDACLSADLLIWDDFMSSQKLSLDEKDWIFQIINGRERANKPIWFTSNITPKEFASEEIPYKLDDKGRTWWRIIGNSNCLQNRATNHRKAFATARMLGVTVEEYEKGMK
ncbi:ATP-binding protein [Psychrobacillus sp. FSL K6-2365]|uniref:ATP-binding protein n=1 Tax=Psychrobacillus sp. FSL K6-2365 TaxID=2921546 RepID=UPI0030F9105F